MTTALPRVALAALALVALLVGLANLDRPLANPDEGRYSEISREMVASGDWVTPRLDAIKYFEKPPLQYWATAAAFEVFGTGEIPARLYVWFAGFATLVIVGFAAARLADPRTGLASVLVLAASPYFMALGGVVTLDMGLTLWTTATFFALLLAEHAVGRPREQRLWMLASWAAMALAVLSKGLVGIVFAGAAVFFVMVFSRGISILRRMHWGWGLAIFLAIAAPWFIAVSRANPEFARFFFIHEHFERFLTHEHRRVQPAWFFVPIVLVGFLAWLPALFAAIASAWRAPEVAGGRPLRVALAWSLFILAFFSASGSKLPTYVLPLFPALAYVVGRYVAHASCRSLSRSAWVFLALSIVLVGTASFLPDFTHDAWNQALYLEARPWAMVAAGALALGAVGSDLALARDRRWLAMASAAMGTVIALGGFGMAYDALTPRQSGLAVAAAMQPFLAANPRAYSVAYYDQTIPFYIRRPVTLVSYVDEFETGLAAEPGLAIARLDDFPAEWLRPGEALAIMQPRAFAQMKALGLPMQVLHEDPRRVLVRKP
ncbi:MAG TPA: glycosyltransferase family 39 protein [Usitatibacter sp.]|nr:glycosyltransferase family 39 protein [Usitatibacter sp.]